MAISKKGLRSIIVNRQQFYWKFNGKVIVSSYEFRNSLLIVDFGWYDVWLYVNDKENRPPDFEPKSVTPKFVSDSIIYALTQGWDYGKMEIEFRNGDYKILYNTM
ncbi:hypothetical protein [Flammeovirga sp. EKP202]|uniref:hypothetical protein n=1 Tax=Flammeovirga sp. EKP202 TaxID=2770592 RepID=UPI00165F3C0C|nr:hypothetical protein [Flammeovirga sp. EKP202]MBD0404912.1 hypothetical protein [Flammeovirga sp. EKP202]